MNKRQDKLIKVETVAELTGLSPKTIYAGEAGTHTLLKVHLGRLIRFSYLDVLRWIEKKKAEAITEESSTNVISLDRVRLTRKQINEVCNKKEL